VTSPHTASDADAPETDLDEGPSSPTRSTTRSVIEWIAVIGGALIVALIIKTFLIQAFYIPSGSMETTLDIGDRVLVNKLSYRVHDVNRGDLVVFEANEGAGDCGQPVSDAAASASESGIKDLIKRVIGLPGDTVEGRDGQLLVNGRLLVEPYLDDGVTTGDFAAVEIPEGCIWVMGDNRGDSRDSRSFGPIDEDQIVGRAFVRVWPLNDLGLL
jgi:signal peptidase I